MSQIQSLKDGICAIFVGSPEFLSKNQEQTKASQLESAGIGVAFVETLEQDLAKVNSKHNNLIFVEKSGNDLKYLIHKENPEAQTNWSEVVLAFIENYKSDQATNGLWKWGQIVPEDGDYLCVDCGYIETLEKGQIFPVCEVCLSGEPAGISGPGEGYWELV